MSLLLVMGLPAAGKSSLCKKILQFRPDGVVFSLDEANGRWSDNFNAHADRKSFEGTVRRHLEAQCDGASEKVVIVDDNFYLRSMRRPFERMARAFQLRYCCVFVEVDVEEALRRNARRGEERVHDDTILRMAREISVPEGAVVYRGGSLDQILQRLRGPRPKRAKLEEKPEAHPGVASALSETDDLLRTAVSEAVREGLDGRRLASAKRVLMGRCRQNKCALTRLEACRALREEYHRLSSSGG